MSYMIISVITKEYPTQDVLKKILQPYHEFESTGVNDEYVVDVDVLDKYKKKYEKECKTYMRDINTNKYYTPWDEIFYRPSTPEEIKLYKTNYWEARDEGISCYKNEYSTKHIPDNFVEEETYIKNVMSFYEWIAEYCYERDQELKKDEIPDKEGAHKYGWFRVDDGKVIEAIKRTNPNYKWDYWHIEPAESNRLYNKYLNRWVNIAKKGELDINRMIKNNQMVIDENKEKWDKRGTAYSKIAYPLTGFAYIKDGNWYERGNMGWWGIVTDEMDTTTWYEQFNKMFTELNDDDYITIVHCHI